MATLDIYDAAVKGFSLYLDEWIGLRSDKSFEEWLEQKLKQSRILRKSLQDKPNKEITIHE